MSWVRWGSPCWASVPAYSVNESCPRESCPGSDVYVYEHADGGFACCCCPLLGGELEDFRALDAAGMRTHLREHREAGHHVRPSLLLDVPQEP